jgi:hypothetical protein
VLLHFGRVARGQNEAETEKKNSYVAEKRRFALSAERCATLHGLVTKQNTSHSS